MPATPNPADVDSPLDAFTKVLSQADDALDSERRDTQWELQQLVSAGWKLVDQHDGAPDLAPLVAARKVLGDLVRAPRYTLTLTTDHRKAEERFLAEAVKLADAAIEKKG